MAKKELLELDLKVSTYQVFNSAVPKVWAADNKKGMSFNEGVFHETQLRKFAVEETPEVLKEVKAGIELLQEYKLLLVDNTRMEAMANAAITDLQAAEVKIAEFQARNEGKAFITVAPEAAKAIAQAYLQRINVSGGFDRSFEEEHGACTVSDAVERLEKGEKFSVVGLKQAMETTKAYFQFLDSVFVDGTKTLVPVAAGKHPEAAFRDAMHPGDPAKEAASRIQQNDNSRNYISNGIKAVETVLADLKALKPGDIAQQPTGKQAGATVELGARRAS